MRPLKLAFQGINSYKDECKINFVELGSNSLFGIFGPTGSGKSTILDAMSLALFNWIPRASKGVGGAGNSSCKKAFVSFDFQCGDGTYRVERKYNISSDGYSLNVFKSAIYTLDEAGNTSIVIAEQSDNVSRKVTEILGLTRLDFQIAVILPQNEFSKFLKSTPADRNKAFERIFRLERYGEHLTAKIKAYLEHLRYFLSNVSGKLEGLQGIDEDGIKALENELKGIEEMLGILKAEKERNERESNHLTRINGLWRERESLIEKRLKLVERSRNIGLLETRLARAQSANELRSSAESYEKIVEKEIPEIEQDLKQTEAQHEIAEREYREVEREWKEFSINYEDRRTELEVRLNRYNSMLDTIVSIKNLGEKTEKLQTKLSRLRSDRVEAFNKLKNADDERQRHSNRTNELEARIRNLSETARLLDSYMSGDKELDAIRSMSARIEESKTALIGQVSSYNDLCGSVLAKLKSIGIECELDLALSKLDERISYLSYEKSEKETHLKALETAQSAAVIAQQLRKDSPCPVCGSKHHPSPAEKPTEDFVALTASIRASEQNINRLSVIRGEISTKIKQLEDMNHDISRVKSAIAENEEIANNRFAEWRQKVGMDKPEFEAKLADAKDAFEKLRELETARESLANERKLIDERFVAASQRHSEIEANIKLESALLEEAESQQAKEARKIEEVFKGEDPIYAINKTTREKKHILDRFNMLNSEKEEKRNKLTGIETRRDGIKCRLDALKNEAIEKKRDLFSQLAIKGFASIADLKCALMNDSEYQSLKAECDEYSSQRNAVISRLNTLDEEIENHPDPAAELSILTERQSIVVADIDKHNQEFGSLRSRHKEATERFRDYQKVRGQFEEINRKINLAEEIESLTKGKALVNFIAEFHLHSVMRRASYLLSELTRRRYRLEGESKSTGVTVNLVDDWNAGTKREVDTLSGGETFLASFALALALSEQISTPANSNLDCLFIDEGFGSLDSESLDTVFDSLERLRGRKRLIGVISHLAAVKERLTAFVEVQPPTPDGAGSRAVIRYSYS